MWEIMLVAIGGAFGALSRYGLGGLAHRIMGSDFPWGTLVVNVLGSFILGTLMELSIATDMVPGPLKLAVGTGFCGALTTFSTFSYETMRLLEDGSIGAAGANVVANLLIGGLACWVGIFLARAMA